MRTVAFVDLSDAFHERHPVYCIAAYLKQNGIRVHYFPKAYITKTISGIREVAPELLLYSAYSRDIANFIAFDRIIKQHVHVKSIIGGPAATFDQQFLKDSTIDALCLGEGEKSLAEFINNGFVPVGNIINAQSNLPLKYDPFLDLDKMPFPDRALVYERDCLLRDMPSKQFLSGRGCPFMCTYCHNNIQNRMFKECGSVIRKKSLDYLFEEINQVKTKYPLKLVVFQDDTFIINKKWFFEFCERFPQEIGLPYTCNIRASLIDEDKVMALKDSGCSCAYWSIESGNDFIRNNLLKRNETLDQILVTADLLAKYKVTHRSGGIVGLPGETFEQMLQTLELNIRIKPHFGFSSIFVPYPGLELTDYAIKHGYLSRESAARLPEGTHVRSALDFSEEENVRIQKLTYLYPLCVSYPKFFYNKKIFAAMFSLPRMVLCLIFNVFSGYKQSKLYKVKMSFSLKMMLLFRYLSNPF